MDDLTAIKRLKRGDLDGLATLVERYQVEAMRGAYLVTHDLSLADDVVQEAFLRFHKHVRSFDEHRAFAPYFMRIVVNMAVDTALRVSQRAERFPALDNEALEALTPDVFFDPEQHYEAAELREAVSDALHNLTPEQRAAVVLRYYYDYSEREVAEALGLPQGTVSWRLHRARKELGSVLQIFRSSTVLTGEGDA